MKNATMLELGNGKEHEIELMSAINGGRQVLIAFYDERPISQIAADFEGVGMMSKKNEKIPNVTEVYEGYTQLVSIQRGAHGDMVRITLARA